MSRVGLLLAVVGVFSLLSVSTHLGQMPIRLEPGVGGLLWIYMGFKLRTASKSLAEIERTQGNDISHLMSGIEPLKAMFVSLQTIIMIVLALLVTFFFCGTAIVGALMLLRP